jgi:hypothetical protein
VCACTCVWSYVCCLVDVCCLACLRPTPPTLPLALAGGWMVAPLATPSYGSTGCCPCERCKAWTGGVAGRSGTPQHVCVYLRGTGKTHLATALPFGVCVCESEACECVCAVWMRHLTTSLSLVEVDIRDQCMPGWKKRMGAVGIVRAPCLTAASVGFLLPSTLCALETMLKAVSVMCLL